MTHLATKLTATQWWERRRLRYNFALVTAIVLGYVAYVVVSRFVGVIGAPIIDENGVVVDHDVEVSGIALIGQCRGAGIGLLFANVFYLLGASVEGLVTPTRINAYRKWAWRAGTAFSCFLPFSIALLHLTLCVFFPSWYDHTPIRLPATDEV